MTDKENIKNIVELFIAWNGETEAIDVANIDSAVDFISDSLQEEPVSDELEEELKHWWNNHYSGIDKKYTFEKYAGHWIENSTLVEIVHHFTNWQKQQLMKYAVDGYVLAKQEMLLIGFEHNPNNIKYGDKVKIIIIKED